MGLAIPKLSHHHGDESFYTNAAIRMVQTGDYWTPYFADGRVRFLKPILTYWAIAGSYKLFGINFTASRLLFALAGCLMVFFTYRLSHVLFGSPQAALLSALMAGSNLQLWTLSIRATPDILVILFSLLSFLGFTKILFTPDRSWSAYLLAYGGAGLAVQTKGLLGVFPVVFVFLYCGVFRRTVQWRSLLHWPAMLAGLVLGSFWYVVVFLKNGNMVFSQFFSDQLTTKVSYNPWYSLQNLASYLFAGLRHFLPWTLIVVGVILAAPTASAAFLRQYKRQCWFLLGAFVALALCFSFGNMRRTRYVAIAYPMLATIMAGIVIHCLSAPHVTMRLAGALRWSGAAICCVALGLTFVGWKLGVGCALSALFVGGVAAWLFIATRSELQERWGLCLAWMLVAGFIALENFWRPIFSVSPAPQLAQYLLQGKPLEGRIYAWEPRIAFADQVRVCAGGQIDIVGLRRTNLTTFPEPLILADGQREVLAGEDWTFEPAATGGAKWSSKDFRLLLGGADAKKLLNEKKETYYVARRRTGIGETSSARERASFGEAR